MNLDETKLFITEPNDEYQAGMSCSDCFISAAATLEELCESKHSPYDIEIKKPDVIEIRGDHSNAINDPNQSDTMHITTEASCYGDTVLIPKIENNEESSVEKSDNNDTNVTKSIKLDQEIKVIDESAKCDVTNCIQIHDGKIYLVFF